MEADKDREIRELRSRLETLEGSRTQSAPAKQSSSTGCATVGVIVGALLLVGYCSTHGGSDLSASSRPTASAEPAWTPPEGYERDYTHRGGGVAVQWEKPTRSECRGYDVTCFALNVVTEKGCPRNLYVSISLFNTSGDNIGWTNDTAQGVMASEKTRLVFTTYERGAASARIAEINCY